MQTLGVSQSVMEVQMSQAEGNLPEHGNHSAATVINMTREGIICPSWM